jgi:thioredoxin-related protein
MGQSTTPAASSSPTDAGNLQWQYDLGAAETTARSINKNMLVFFVAKGNHWVEKYESDFFTNPAVRAALDKFVLVKVDFPENTRLAYQLEIYGAGMIAITDSTAGKIKTITAIPSTPADLVPLLDVPTMAAKP